MTTLTEAQDQVLKQVDELLSEHFDCHTLAVEIDLEEVDDEGQQCTFWRGLYGGGKGRAKGLTLSHLDNLREIKASQPETD